MITAAAMFVCSNRLADAGRSRTEVAMVFAAWAVIYIIFNQILAHFVTSRNAAIMLIAADLIFAAVSVLFVLVENILAIYAVMGILAIATSLFFLPFQIFMKAAEPDQHQGLVRSVAIYTFSWSLGFASGPFIAGFIYQLLGWQWCFAFTGLLAIISAIGVQLLKHHAKYHHDEIPAADKDSGIEADVNYHMMPNMAWLGWTIAGVGCFGIYSFLALLPSIGVVFAIPKSHVGLITGMVYFVQGILGLALIRGRVWMFRPIPAVCFGMFGLFSMLIFCLSLLPMFNGAALCSFPLRTIFLYASAICYGVFSGGFYFVLVFYSLMHPGRSARNVGINEMVVGICGVAGPVLAGTLADVLGFAAFPILLMIMLAAVMTLQYFVLRPLEGKCKSLLTAFANTR